MTHFCSQSQLVIYEIRFMKLFSVSITSEIFFKEQVKMKHILPSNGH